MGRRGFRPRHRSGRRFVPAAASALRTRKPDWVVDEVIRLKAHLAGPACRKIADTFNRLHAARHATTVSKTYVADTVRRHRLAIEERRREWQRRIARFMATNHLWGVDLTGKRDIAGDSHPILGILDHGSRLAVCLDVLSDKASITVLRTLLDAIERYGRPRSIRTDNEAVFTSRLFRFGLWLLGIRHQRTEPHCPWQNGRVERFFGTLKEKLDRWAVSGMVELQYPLADFAVWYNHVRPHQHLAGRTPGEASSGVNPFVRAPREAHYFSAWDGMLTGIRLRY